MQFNDTIKTVLREEKRTGCSGAPFCGRIMRIFFALTIVLGIATAAFGAFAGEIKNGATMQVKANSIWFQDPALLARWQKLKKAGDAKALAQYQDKVLRARDAWQFLDQLPVKILRYEPGKHRVSVEMTTEGRLNGTTWSIDPDALVQ
jgi:hypothetical protein